MSLFESQNWIQLISQLYYLQTNWLVLGIGTVLRSVWSGTTYLLTQTGNGSIRAMIVVSKYFGKFSSKATFSINRATEKCINDLLNAVMVQIKLLPSCRS